MLRASCLYLRDEWLLLSELFELLLLPLLLLLLCEGALLLRPWLLLLLVVCAFAAGADGLWEAEGDDFCAVICLEGSDLWTVDCDL